MIQQIKSENKWVVFKAKFADFFLKKYNKLYKTQVELANIHQMVPNIVTFFASLNEVFWNSMVAFNLFRKDIFF